MITIDNVQYRNLEEQVQKNKDDIQYIIEEEGVLNQFGIKVVGEIPNISELPNPTTYQGNFGDAYAVGTGAPYTLYIYTRANGAHPDNYWFNIGEFPAPGTIPGPTGPQGPAGPQGIQGEDGKDAVVSQVVLTIDPSDWNNKTVTKAVSVTSSNNVIVGPTPASYDLYGLCGIRCTQQVTGGIVLTCITVPTQVIYVNVLVLNGGI